MAAVTTDQVAADRVGQAEAERRAAAPLIRTLWRQDRVSAEMDTIHASRRARPTGSARREAACHRATEIG